MLLPSSVAVQQPKIAAVQQQYSRLIKEVSAAAQQRCCPATAKSLLTVVKAAVQQRCCPATKDSLENREFFNMTNQARIFWNSESAVQAHVAKLQQPKLAENLSIGRFLLRKDCFGNPHVEFGCPSEILVARSSFPGFVSQFANCWTLDVPIRAPLFLLQPKKFQGQLLEGWGAAPHPYISSYLAVGFYL